MNIGKLFFGFLLFCAFDISLLAIEPAIHPVRQEHKDAKGNVLIQEIAPAPNGKVTVALNLQIPSGKLETVKMETLLKRNDLGYTIEFFQYQDGVLDTIQNVPGDAQMFVQLGKVDGTWRQTKVAGIGTEYSRNSRSISYRWLGKGRFEIKSWKHGISEPPDGVTTDVIDVLDKKVPGFPTLNAALRNGEPYNFKVESKQISK